MLKKGKLIWICDIIILMVTKIALPSEMKIEMLNTTNTKTTPITSAVLCRSVFFLMKCGGWSHTVHKLESGT